MASFSYRLHPPRSGSYKAAVSKPTKPSQPAPKVSAPSPDEFKKMLKGTGLRLGIPLLVIWIVVILIGHPIGLIIAGVLTAAGIGLVVWAIYYMNKSKRVAGILSSADMSSPEGRKKAMDQLETSAGKGDTAALFAKAQLLMHEDPRKALEVLEQINLDKVMAPIADEARGQRAMIHLLLGEIDRARALVDGIDLTRHEQTKARAALASVVAEAWARSGQAKKANETLDLFDPESGELEEVKPQLYRARAFAAASLSDTKRMKHALRRLKAINVQLLAGFVQKRVHPLLEKEARQMLMQSGAVPKKMVRQKM